MTADLERLMAVVDGATQGEWDEELGVVWSVREYGITTLIADIDVLEDAAYIATFDPPTVRALLTELSALRESEARMREALGGLYELCIVGASPDAFKNGVTDSTGMIDEGDVRACELIDRARAALAQGERR